jgi:hypothetical protein
MIPYRSALARSAALFALCLPLSSLACSGSGFSAGSPDGSSGDDGGDGGGVVVVGDSGGRDATSPTDSGVVDAHHDAHHDGGGPEDSGTLVDSGLEDTGSAMDSGNGCGPGFLACDAGCVASGVMNCGTCGNDCANLPHVSGPTSCAASGMCSFPMSSCEPGWADCDGRPDNGCETPTTQSPNCGGCGVTCPSGMPVCNGTACVTGCSGGTPDPCGSTCTNKNTDPQNCSTCGHVCAAGPTNSQASCAGGVCGYTCTSGYSDCNLGCIDEENDPNNCGTCGKQCTGPANSTVKCATGNCGWACDPTFRQCPDSTCDNVNTDVSHCGSSCTDCSTASPPPANGTDVCSSGTCDFTCSAGFVKCEATLSCSALAGTGAYVQAGSGFSPPNCGTAGSPCSTIQAGIAFATQQGLTMVYVADGTYPESPTVTASMTIQGGWTLSGGSWARDCPPNSASTKIVAPNGSQTAFGIDAGSVTLDTLSIANNNVATAGQTLFGVSVVASDTADLRNVIIDVAAGGAGVPGGVGSSAGSTPTSCSAGTGGVGSTGGAGSAAPAGTWGAGGYVLGVASPGLPGGDGLNGTAAPASGQPNGPTCVSDDRCPTTRIDPSCTAIPANSCGTAGTNGCGAYGSSGGYGGSGGGATVGIFAWGATVTLDGPPGKVTVGAGGNGGNGGPAGTPGTGSASAGGAPGPQACQSCVVQGSGMAAYCELRQCGSGGAAGGKGGTGGNGGPGGRGGGGSGGDSLCYVAGGGGSVTTTWPSTYCTFSTGGLGGNQGGASQGATGNAGVHN